jgi:hypothetical protein
MIPHLFGTTTYILPVRLADLDFVNVRTVLEPSIYTYISVQLGLRWELRQKGSREKG